MISGSIGSVSRSLKHPVAPSKKRNSKLHVFIVDDIWLYFLEINIESKEERPRSWINIVVDTVADFRIQSFVRRYHQRVLSRYVYIEVGTSDHIVKVVTCCNVIQPEKRGFGHKVVAESQFRLVDNIQIYSRLVDV